MVWGFFSKYSDVFVHSILLPVRFCSPIILPVTLIMVFGTRVPEFDCFWQIHIQPYPFYSRFSQTLTV